MPVSENGTKPLIVVIRLSTQSSLWFSKPVSKHHISKNAEHEHVQRENENARPVGAMHFERRDHFGRRWTVVCVMPVHRECIGGRRRTCQRPAIEAIQRPRRALEREFCCRDVRDPPKGLPILVINSNSNKQHS